MVDAGLQANFVDTQQITLTNITDSLTYIQITDFETNIDSNVIKHHLTDDIVDNVFGLYGNYIQGNMWATTPQWAALVTLTKDVSGIRPVKVWQVLETDQSTNPITTSINGQLKTLRKIDTGIGAVKLFFRIEGDEVLTVA